LGEGQKQSQRGVVWLQVLQDVKGLLVRARKVIQWRENYLDNLINRRWI
jgi:hypothetical protein